MNENYKKESEIEKENRDKLLTLIREHPELPIVPMVDGEIVSDDRYAWWLGHWGDAEVDGYISTGEQILFRDWCDMEDAVSAVYGYETLEKMTDEEYEQAYKEIEWTEAIVIKIVS